MLEDRRCQGNLTAPKSLIRHFWMRKRCGTWVALEFESLKKLSSDGYNFSFPLETVFNEMSPSLNPGAVEGNSAGLRRLHGMRKRNAPGGRASPPRTSPERASNLTRSSLGGGGLFRAPSRFLAISSKPMQLSPPNLQYPLSQQFYTLC